MFTDVDSKTSFVGTVDVLQDIILKPPKKRRNPFGGSDVMLFLDADTLCYQAAAATDGSYWVIIGSTTGTVMGNKRFKYKKDAEAYYKERNFSTNTYEQRWEPEPLANALKILQTSLEIFKDNDCTYYLTPKMNFRNVVASDYKANRRGKRRPEHLTACKDFLIMSYGAIMCEDMEADDAVIIATMEYVGTSAIIGVDKDLRQIKGDFYDFKGKRTRITKAEARENLWRQIAAGDTTDNIITPKGLGPKTFDKAYSSVDWLSTSDYDLMQLMIALYKRFEKQELGEGMNFETEVEYSTRIILWIKRTAQLVYLLRSVDDSWTLPENDGSIRW